MKLEGRFRNWKDKGRTEGVRNKTEDRELVLLLPIKTRMLNASSSGFLSVSFKSAISTAVPCCFTFLCTRMYNLTDFYEFFHIQIAG
jgi:hypothetical protein